MPNTPDKRRPGMVVVTPGREKALRIAAIVFGLALLIFAFALVELDPHRRTAYIETHATAGAILLVYLLAPRPAWWGAMLAGMAAGPLAAVIVEGHLTPGIVASAIGNTIADLAVLLPAAAALAYGTGWKRRRAHDPAPPLPPLANRSAPDA